MRANPHALTITLDLTVQNLVADEAEKGVGEPFDREAACFQASPGQGLFNSDNI